MSGRCGACSTRLSDSPGGKYYRCLECDISLCKFCYEQRAEPKDHEESHNMRMIDIDDDDDDDE